MVRMNNLSQKIRHLFEALLTVLLFGMQTIYNMGIFMGIMSIPLLPYIWFVLTDKNYANAFWFNIEYMFFTKDFLISRIITFIGVFVLLLALAQFIWSRHKRNKLVQSGLYSKIRHPQFTGIIIITFGLTLMVTKADPTMNVLLRTTDLWLIQVLGYMTIAKYEDWKLQKEIGNDYNEYRQNVPFLFPIRSPKRIPETLFTILIAITIWFILLVFTYVLCIS
jgi:protein-S-isoprenylcysteine O-methyltransferase Ste14